MMGRCEGCRRRRVAEEEGGGGKGAVPPLYREGARYIR